MRFALVIASLGPGGAERVISELANRWMSQGHVVALITLDCPQNIPFYSLDPRIQLVQIDQKSQSTTYVGRFVEIIKRLFVLRQSIKSIRPDAVLSFVDITNLVTLLSCMRLNIPIVVSERIDPHHHPIPRPYKWLRRKLYRLAQRIVVQTRSAADYFDGELQNKITIIPNFVQRPVVCAEIRPKVQTIVSAGRLERQKDFTTLIQAFDRVIRVESDLRLIIYGEGSERKNLTQLVESLNLSDKVFFPGATQYLAAELVKADIFVFPSLYEGFPNALCEAMALGLPVVASNCSGNTDIVRDGVDGRLFPVGCVDDLTMRLLELIQAENQRVDLAENAKDVVQRFSADTILKLWDQLFLPSSDGQTTEV